MISLFQSNIIQSISSLNINRNFKTDRPQFYIITSKGESEDVKETIRIIEKIFMKINTESETGKGFGLAKLIEVFELERNAVIEHKFGLRKQISREGFPEKINTDKGENYLLYLLLFKSYEASFKSIKIYK